MQGLTLAGNTEDKLTHLLDQLLVRNASRAPPMHAVVALGVKVAIRQDPGLAPVLKR